MSDDESGRPHLRLISGQAPTGEGPPPGDPVVPDPAPPSIPNPYPPGSWAMLHDQTGRVVLLTGHGGGLAIAIATALADAGARLAIADRDPDRARLVARASSRSASEGSVALGLDPSRPEQVRRGIGAVEQITGRLDGLVVIVDQGRASSAPDGEPGVTLGEMIHLVRAAERRMTVLGGGRIVVIAAGVPRDPAVAAITAGAVTEFVRTRATGPAAGIVSINAVIVEQGHLAPALDPASGPAPESVPTAPLPPDGTTTAGTSRDNTGRDDTERDDEAADDSGQSPVLPFRFAIRSGDPAEPPASPPLPVPDAPMPPDDGPIADLSAVVASAALFLAPATSDITGQVLRLTIPAGG